MSKNTVFAAGLPAKCSIRSVQTILGKPKKDDKKKLSN